MKISLKRKSGDLHFESANSEGLVVSTDASAAAGGEGKGVRPMELILMGLASCSSIDVVLLLKKMRKKLDDIQVDVQAERAESAPRVFTKIHIHYKLFGDIPTESAEKAIRLSMTEACSVSKMLEKTADITWSYEILPFVN